MRPCSSLLLLAYLCTASAALHSGELSADKLCKNVRAEFPAGHVPKLPTYPLPEANELGGRAARFLRRDLLVDSASMENFFSPNGGLPGIQATVRKLLQGQAVTVVALGGSVTRGHGVQDPANGWVAQLFAWIQSTFPKARHRLLNRAIPAVTSGYISACIPELVPTFTDLVIVEFTYNDNVFGGSNCVADNPARRGLERLLRRLTTQAQQPGILYFHYWPPARFKPVFMNNEDAVDTLLKYYHVPSVSMRDALFDRLVERPEYLDEFWAPAPDPKIHPTCLGARVMADLVIIVLWQLLLDITKGSGTFKSPKHPKLHRPFLLEGNWGHTHTACILESDIRAFVRENKGWDWVDEGRTKRQHKRGFISVKPGDYIELEAPLNHLPKLTKQYLIGVGGLISYQHMGVMDLQCFRGCSCLTVRHNMFHAQEFSMTGWRYLNVTQVSDYPCIIRATNRQETWTSEHKLKISSMMLSIKGEVDHPREGRSNGLSSTDILKSAMSGLRSSEFVLDAENT